MVPCNISSYICLSADAVDWQSLCFVNIVLYYALPNFTSVIVLFVIFGGLFIVG